MRVVVTIYLVIVVLELGIILLLVVVVLLVKAVTTWLVIQLLLFRAAATVLEKVVGWRVYFNHVIIRSLVLVLLALFAEHFLFV